MNDRHERLGSASSADLVALFGRGALRQAVAAGSLERYARGYYRPPDLRSPARDLALAHRGVVSHLSAALHHGWKVKTEPDRIWITVPRHRNLCGGKLSGKGLRIVASDLTERDSSDRVTTPMRTIVDCARSLPFDEALCVADSALRVRAVEPEEMIARARTVRGPGARRVVRVLHHADRRSSGPFESVLRAICLDVPGLSVVPQQCVAEPGLFAIVDLADLELRLAIEADSFGFHASRSRFAEDCRRYDELVAYGWTVLRFSWDDVMRRPQWVADVLSRAVALRRAG